MSIAEHKSIIISSRFWSRLFKQREFARFKLPTAKIRKVQYILYTFVYMLSSDPVSILKTNNQAEKK